MTTVIEEFVAKLGWEIDDKDVKEFDENVTSLGKTIASVAAIITGATAAIIALTGVTNRQTAVNANLARSFNINETALENWGYLLSAVGMDATAILDTMKDFSMKMGKVTAGLGPVDAMRDSLKALNLEFSDLKGLSPEQQYKKILNALKDLKDPMVAMSIANEMFGEQGVRVVGFLRQQKGTLEEILERQNRLNLMTDKARQSAIDYIALWDDTLAVIDSAKALFSALVGEALTPMLKEFTDWVAENKDLIRTKVKKWVDDFIRVLKVLGGILKFVYDKIDKAITAMGGFEKAIKLASLAFKIFIGLKTLAAVSAFIKLIKEMTGAQIRYTAKVKLSAIAMAGLRILGVGLFVLIAEDIATYLLQGDKANTLTGLLSEKFEGLLDKVHDWIAAWLGVTPEQLRYAQYKALMMMEEDWDNFWKAVGIDFSRFWTWLTTGWSDIPGTLKKDLDKFTAWLKEDVDKWITWFIDIPDKIVAAFKDLGPKIKPHLPGFLQLLIGKGGSPTLPPTGAPLMPSPSVINNKGGQSNRVTIQNNMSVTQLPGEDSTDFAYKVSDIITGKTALAVGSTDSGVDY